MLENLTIEKLHHTNVCIGNRDIIIEDINACISTYRKSIQKVERLVYEFDKFLIEDAEHIFSRHIHKIGQNEMQCVIIAFNSTSSGAQNSILKILEEPPVGVYFFLFVPNKKIILPTVLSRAQIFEYSQEIEISKETKDFLSSTYSERLDIVKKILDDLKNEKKTKQEIIEFVEEIEKYIHEKKDMNVLKKILQIKEYMKDHGASVKQLLEYLAIVI